MKSEWKLNEKLVVLKGINPCAKIYQLDDLVIQDSLGSGKFGEVRKVQLKSSKELFAMKTSKPGDKVAYIDLQRVCKCLAIHTF